MSDRKQTPDILADILNGAAPAPELDFAPPPRKARKTPAAKPAPANPATAETGAPAPAAPKAPRRPAVPAPPPGWVYQIASFQEHKGWRLRYLDGRQLPDWADGPTLAEHLAQAGAQGWELAGTCSGEPLYGKNDRFQLFFKRPQV